MQFNWMMQRTIHIPLLVPVLSVLCLPSSDVRAEPPRVRFDVAYTVGCPDVTTAEFATVNPGERLVEARLQVSSLIGNGAEDDLIEYFYRIESPQPGVQVIDYLPRTTLSSEVAGNIAIEEKEDRSASVGLAVTGSYEYIVKATPTVGVDSRRMSTVRYELLPPKDLLAASGTVQRGQGVYFKLKPSSRTSLEGGKEFVVVLRAPRDWRGGAMHVSCRALGLERSVLRAFDERDLSGSGDFVVALYADGDVEAKAIAGQYERAETMLRTTAARHHDQIQKNSYRTVVHRIGSILTTVDRQIPSNWMSRLVFARNPNAASFTSHLPPPVRDAVNEYLATRQALWSLGGGYVDELARIAR